MCQVEGPAFDEMPLEAEQAIVALNYTKFDGKNKCVEDETQSRRIAISESGLIYFLFLSQLKTQIMPQSASKKKSDSKTTGQQGGQKSTGKKSSTRSGSKKSGSGDQK